MQYPVSANGALDLSQYKSPPLSNVVSPSHQIEEPTKKTIPKKRPESIYTEVTRAPIYMNEEIQNLDALLTYFPE
jgi:hypothetical protein